MSMSKRVGLLLRERPHIVLIVAVSLIGASANIGRTLARSQPGRIPGAIRTAENGRIDETIQRSSGWYHAERLANPFENLVYIDAPEPLVQLAEETPSDQAPPPVLAPVCNLTAIVRGAVPRAVIDGRIVRVGDRIGAHTVGFIDDRGVVLRSDGGEFVLSLR